MRRVYALSLSVAAVTLIVGLSFLAAHFGDCRSTTAFVKDAKVVEEASPHIAGRAEKGGSRSGGRGSSSTTSVVPNSGNVETNLCVRQYVYVVDRREYTLISTECGRQDAAKVYYSRIRPWGASFSKTYSVVFLALGISFCVISGIIAAVTVLNEVRHARRSQVAPEAVLPV